MGNAVAAQLSSNLGPTLQSTAPQQSSPTSQQSITPRPSSSLNQNMDRESSLSILNAPPIPPRTTNSGFGIEMTDRRPSATSTSTNNSQMRSSPRFPSNPTSSHESLSTSQPVTSPRDQNITPRQQLNSRDSLSIAPLEMVGKSIK